MRGFYGCTNRPSPKPDIDEMIFGTIETIPSER